MVFPLTDPIRTPPVIVYVYLPVVGDFEPIKLMFPPVGVNVPENDGPLVSEMVNELPTAENVQPLPKQPVVRLPVNSAPVVMLRVPSLPVMPVPFGMVTPMTLDPVIESPVEEAENVPPVLTQVMVLSANAATGNASTTKATIPANLLHFMSRLRGVQKVLGDTISVGAAIKPRAVRAFYGPKIGSNIIF